MKLLRESMGDIKLCKFIVLICPKVAGVAEKNYVDEIGAYIFSFSFGYNVYMNQVDDNYMIHRDFLDTLPKKITKTRPDHLFGNITFGETKENKMAKVLHFLVTSKQMAQYKEIIEYMKEALKPFDYKDVVFYDDTWGAVEE